MPAYHSKLREDQADEACGCAILPLHTSFRGPAPLPQPGRDDIVEETLYYFRANVLYRNYQIEGPADRTLIYLTFFVQQCLKELEKHPFKKEDQFKAYMRQCREELAKRLGNRVYQEDGSRNKHWMLFSKRKFMGKEMI